MASGKSGKVAVVFDEEVKLPGWDERKRLPPLGQRLDTAA